MFKWLKRLFCRHEWIIQRIFGEVSVCIKCEKMIVKDPEKYVPEPGCLDYRVLWNPKLIIEEYKLCNSTPDSQNPVKTLKRK